MDPKLSADINTVREALPNLHRLAPWAAHKETFRILYGTSEQPTAETTRYANLVRDHALGII